MTCEVAIGGKGYGCEEFTGGGGELKAFVLKKRRRFGYLLHNLREVRVVMVMPAVAVAPLLSLVATNERDDSDSISSDINVDNIINRPHSPCFQC